MKGKALYWTIVHHGRGRGTFRFCNQEWNNWFRQGSQTAVEPQAIGSGKSGCAVTTAKLSAHRGLTGYKRSNSLTMKGSGCHHVNPRINLRCADATTRHSALCRTRLTVLPRKNYDQQSLVRCDQAVEWVSFTRSTGQRGTGEIGPKEAVREGRTMSRQWLWWFQQVNNLGKEEKLERKLRLKENQFVKSWSWFESTVNKTLRQVEELATKSDILNLIPRTHRVEGEDLSLRATFRPIRVWPYATNQEINQPTSP